MATTQSKFHQYYAMLSRAKSVPDLVTTLSLAFKNLALNQDQLYSQIPQLGIIHEDAPLQATSGRIAIPPAGQFSVQQSGGITFVTIIDPQDRTSQSSSQRSLLTQSNPNTVLTPIIHSLRSAASQAFDATANVQVYLRVPNHFSKPDTNAYWQLQSSYDGKNFNAWSAAQFV